MTNSELYYSLRISWFRRFWNRLVRFYESHQVERIRAYLGE